MRRSCQILRYRLVPPRVDDLKRNLAVFSCVKGDREGLNEPFHSFMPYNIGFLGNSLLPLAWSMLLPPGFSTVLGESFPSGLLKAQEEHSAPLSCRSSLPPLLCFRRRGLGSSGVRWSCLSGVLPVMGRNFQRFSPVADVCLTERQLPSFRWCDKSACRREDTDICWRDAPSRGLSKTIVGGVLALLDSASSARINVKRSLTAYLLTRSAEVQSQLHSMPCVLSRYRDGGHQCISQKICCN